MWFSTTNSNTIDGSGGPQPTISGNDLLGTIAYTVAPALGFFSYGPPGAGTVAPSLVDEVQIVAFIV
jgi:hypothetical protein